MLTCRTFSSICPGMEWLAFVNHNLTFYTLVTFVWKHVWSQSKVTMQFLNQKVNCSSLENPHNESGLPRRSFHDENECEWRNKNWWATDFNHITFYFHSGVPTLWSFEIVHLSVEFIRCCAERFDCFVVAESKKYTNYWV